MGGTKIQGVAELTIAERKIDAFKTRAEETGRDAAST
jgi:hypothetical protein